MRWISKLGKLQPPPPPFTLDLGKLVEHAVGRQACSPWRDGWVGESWEKKREPWCYMGRDLGAIGKERLVRLVILGRPGNGATSGMGGKSGEHTCMETGWLSLCKFMHPLIDIVATSIQNRNISGCSQTISKFYVCHISTICWFVVKEFVHLNYT